MDDKKYLVALSLVSQLGARSISRLLKTFGSAKSAFEAGEKDLAESGLPPKAVAAMLREREKIDPDREWDKLSNANIGVLAIDDPLYPPLLKEIFDPPAVLYYRGEPGVFFKPCVAVVGSRSATEYGKSAAFKIAAELAAAGVTVVSGMARGIDTQAHLGALKANGSTVAVLGSGLDICYPPENIALREKIAKSGAVISEFPPGTGPKPYHFPMRNRIISGLSLATVVVEAREKSGALITADCALEQGRDVFAVPGSINSPYSAGCHNLIKEGALLAASAADILRELGLPARDKVSDRGGDGDGDKETVLKAMQYEPVHLDSLHRTTGMGVAELLAVLTELEMEDKVKKMPGNFYIRV